MNERHFQVLLCIPTLLHTLTTLCNTTQQIWRRAPRQVLTAFDRMWWGGTENKTRIVEIKNNQDVTFPIPYSELHRNPSKIIRQYHRHHQRVHTDPRAGKTPYPSQIKQWKLTSKNPTISIIRLCKSGKSVLTISNTYSKRLINWHRI